MDAEQFDDLAILLHIDAVRFGIFGLIRILHEPAGAETRVEKISAEELTGFECFDRTCSRDGFQTPSR